MSGGQSNTKATALQEESLALQRREFLFNNKFRQRQLTAMEAQQPEPYRPQPANPTQQKAGADDARLSLRDRMLRKFGMGKTIVGGVYAA